MKRLWHVSMAGVRANLIPGAALWVVGLAVVFTYYYSDSSKAIFLQIMSLKETYGYAYSAVATAIFGGLIPFLYLWKLKQVPRGKEISWLAFFVIYWTVRGVEVDALYRLQSWIFGDQSNWQTVVAKVAVDQFIYCVVWSAPVTAICYGWRNIDFSWTRYRKNFKFSEFAFEVASVLLSIWIVWIPATAIIYSLPLPLQVPLFNLVLCFFVLLISILSFRKSMITPTD